MQKLGVIDTSVKTFLQLPAQHLRQASSIYLGDKVCSYLPVDNTLKVFAFIFQCTKSCSGLVYARSIAHFSQLVTTMYTAGWFSKAAVYLSLGLCP